jgi:thiol-disulfide isomerase/thioredoxin
LGHSGRMNKIHTCLIILGVTFVVLLFLKYNVVRDSYDGFQSGVDTFTMYYASWCPHCKNVKPIFKSWGADKGSIQVNGKTVFVKLVEEQEMKADDLNKSLVRGYPTFILNRAGNSAGMEFDGERTPEGWASWLGTKV